MNDELSLFARQTDASISTIHHILRAPRRRLIILLLANKERIGPEQCDKQVSMSARELAKWIVSFEESTSVEHATGDAYHNAYSAITQVHLPRLDEVGAIKYENQRKIVKPGVNLTVFAAIVSVTSPLTRILFQTDIATLYARGHERDGKPQSAIEEDPLPR